MEKYKLDTTDAIEVEGHTLYRIIALIDCPRYFHKGQKGGYIEPNTLSHEGSCWIYDNAKVYGNSIITDNSVVSNDAIVCNSMIEKNSTVRNNAKVENSIISRSMIVGSSKIYNSEIKASEVLDNVSIKRSSIDYCYIHDQAIIIDSSISTCRVNNNVEINNTKTLSNVNVTGNTIINSDKDFIIFKNNFSSFRYFLWTNDDMWAVGCFHGTGEELIKQAYDDSPQKGKLYEAYVKFIETFKQL